MGGESLIVEKAHRPLVVGLAILAVIAPFDLVVGRSDTVDRLLLRPLPAIALAIALAAVISVRSSLRHHPSVVALTLTWVGFVWVSAVASADVFIGAGGAMRVTTAALVMVAAAVAVDDVPGSERSMLIAALGGASVGAVIGLAVVIVGDDIAVTSQLHGSITEIAGRDRLTRPWTHANVAAMALGAALPLAVIVRRRLAIPLGALLAVAMLFTISRGALLAVGAMAVVAAVLRPSVRRLGTTIALVATMAVGVAIIPGWGIRTAADTDGGANDRNAVVSAPAQIDITATGDAAITITIANEGLDVWRRGGDEAVEVSARWLITEEAGEQVVVAEQRWPLPDDVAPGEGAALGLALDVGLPDGAYVVLWDLVIDREAYFLQFAGRSAPSDVRITDSAIVDLPSGATPLVTPRTNLERRQIWRLAIDRFSEQPLLGVGPNQLGLASKSDVEAGQRFPGQHAHNIALEPLATWGLLGSVPFFGLVVGAIVLALRRARSSADALDLAVALSLVAVVAHGMVDWHFGFTSLGLPVALVIGIAWGRY